MEDRGDRVRLGTGRTTGRVPTLRGRVRALLAALLIALFVVGATGGIGLAISFGSLQTVTSRLGPARLANVRALQALTDAETGLRGFQITGEPAFLQPYRRGLADYHDSIADLRGLVREPGSLRLLDRESAAARHWMRYAGHTLDQLRAHRSSADDMPAVQRGKSLFDRFRTANAAVQADATARRSAALDRAHTTRTITLAVLGALTIAILVAGAVIARATVRQLTVPMGRLRAALHRLTTGDWSARAEPVGPAELRGVATAVNVLAERTERLQAIESERARMDALGRELGRRVAGHLDLDAVLAESVRVVGETLVAQRCVIRLLHGEAFGPVAGEWMQDGVAPIETLSRTLPAGFTDLLRRMVHERQPLRVTDTADDPRVDEMDLAGYSAQVGTRSLLAQPLLVDDEMVGVLTVIHDEPREWTDAEQGFVAAVAADAARAISNARLYQSQQRLVEQLQELDRSKADFLSTVSHELRTPLTSIIGYVELMREDLEPDDPQRRMLDTVDRNANRLRSLVEDLLTLSRVESGTLASRTESVDVSALVDGVVTAIRPNADAAGVTLDVVHAEDGTTVTGDQDQLERVLLSLLSNAVKFTASGGHVTLHAARDDDAAVLSVTDTGIGIPAAEKDKLFTRFFRASNATQRAIQGTGLGLNIVGGIVERHRGTLAVDSEEDVGTTITVRLPLGGPLSVARRHAHAETD